MPVTAEVTHSPDTEAFCDTFRAQTRNIFVMVSAEVGSNAKVQSLPNLGEFLVIGEFLCHCIIS